MNRISKYAAAVFLIAGAASAAPPLQKEPIYIYLYARVTDHVNLDTTEDRLRRLLPMIEKYRKEQPQAHVSATILFSAAVSQALERRNGQTHIVDFTKDYIRRGIIEPGYDGSDEPTYKDRPLLDFSNAPTAEDRWLTRAAAEERFLTESRDPLTGAVQPGITGGLKKVREVFGDVACLTGITMWMNVSSGGSPSRAMDPDPTLPDPHFIRPLKKPPVYLTGLKPEVGGDPELVQLLRRDNANALMFGISDTNPGFLPGFTNGREQFGQLMSPIPESSPELFWQDHVLRSSEASGTVRLVHAFDGPDAMKIALGKADRSRIHVIHVELASDRNYLQPAFVKGGEFPPLKFAYSHPDNPKLPSDALLPATAVDEAYAKEDGLLKWLTEEFLPSEHGSRVVSSTELVQMAVPSTGFSVSVEGLRASLVDYLKAGGEDTILPPVFRADGHYLSLADTFQVTADALTEFSRTGKLPKSVKVVRVYGPVRLLTGHGPNEGEVSVASVVRVCAAIDGALHDETPDKIPRNAIPALVTVDGIKMNPAQFLRLMALALENPSPEAKIPVRMLYAFNGVTILYPKLRRLSDDGFGWTLKPAPLEIPGGSSAP